MQAIQNLTRNFQPASKSEKTAVLVNSHQPTNSTATSTTAPPPICHNAIYVWDALAQIYGAAFTNQFGTRPNQFWNAKLSELSLVDIQFGLEQCQCSRNQFAPDLPQFLAYCTPPIVEDVYKSCRETQILLAKPKPECSEAVKNAALAEMKNLLKFKPKMEAV